MSAPSSAARELSRGIAELLAVPQADAEKLGLATFLQWQMADLLESFGNMIGWANYGEEADPWFFSEDQAPAYKAEMKAANMAFEKWKAGE